METQVLKDVVKFFRENNISWRLSENPNPQFTNMRFKFFAHSALVSLGYATGYGKTRKQAFNNFAGTFSHIVRKPKPA